MSVSPPAELENSLADARFELSSLKAKSAFKEIVRECESALREDAKLWNYSLVASAAYSDLAALEFSSESRLGYRRKAIKVLGKASDAPPGVVIERANRAVDLFYDPYAKESLTKIQHILAENSDTLGVEAANTTVLPISRSRMLGQRSSILRCQALIATKADAQRRVAESVRCANKAVELAEADLFAYVELGQAYLAQARYAVSDEDCFRSLQSAEKALLRTRESHEPLSRLVLARFFRQSYRPAQAVEYFREYEALERLYRRRLLQEAFLLGESAMLLWYRSYDKSLVEEALTDARRVLLDAVEAGYGIARNYVSLAFVQAALGDHEAADSILKKLSSGEITSWLEVISKAEEAIETDNLTLLTEAFLLGLDQGMVWNSLGTYASKFLKDDSLARRLYSIGIRLSPGNHILLTNLARVLIRSGVPESLIKAQDLLTRAANSSPRTFVWWRAIQQDLQIKRGKGSRPFARSALDLRPKKVQFRDIQKRYHAITAAIEEDAIKGQRRGYILEEIVHDLFKITFGTQEVEGSHHISGRQVDAAFTYCDHRYRVEVKWLSKPVDRSHLDAANSRLKQAEVRGLFISMTGYTEPAIEIARQFGEDHVLLLIDGEEFHQVLEGHIRFESLLEWKMMEWRRSGNPYAKVEGLEVEA